MLDPLSTRDGQPPSWIERVEAFSEPAVDRIEQFASLLRLAARNAILDLGDYSFLSNFDQSHL
jgi:hypothetical protein